MNGKMTKITVSVLSVLLVLSISMIPLAPVTAWEYWDGTPSDTKFEKFGPRADKLLINLNSTAIGEVDIVGSGMSPTYTGGNYGVFVIPDDGENAYRGYYWDGAVNETGYGFDNYWSFLNMHPRGFERGTGNMTIRWGLPITLGAQGLNPIYASGDDWRVLNLTYDSLLKQNPYNFTEFMPWLVEDYTVGTYVHPVFGICSNIKFTLRPDAMWADMTPLTVADVYFTFVELDDILGARGLPPPSWRNNVKNILDFRVTDPYNFEILLNVNDNTAVPPILTNIIVPKHIWNPICRSGDPTGFAPDPYIVGSGPWKLSEYVPSSHILLVPHKTDAWMTISNKNYYLRYSPVECCVNLSTSKVAPNTIVQPYVLIRNLKDSSFNVVIFIDFDGDLIDIRTPTLNAYSELVLGPYSLNISAGFHWISATCLTISGGLTGRDHEHFKWIWGSTKEDITGTFEFDSWLVQPDFKVDIKDIATAAKAFGSYPGHQRWSSVADINGDYKIDIKDIAAIAKLFGWTQTVGEKENVQKWPPYDGKNDQDLDCVPVQKPGRWFKQNVDGVDGDDYLLVNQTDVDGNIVQLWVMNNGQYGVRYYDAKTKKWVWIGQCPFITGDNSESFKEKDKKGKFVKVKWISKCDEATPPQPQVGTPGDRWEYEYDPATGKLTAKKYDKNNNKIGGPDDPFDPPAKFVDLPE